MKTVEKPESVSIINLRGNISQANAKQVRTPLLETIQADECQCLWLNMSGVKFMDSTGLGIIVKTHSRAKHQEKRLILSHLNPNVLMVFELTGLDEVLEFSNEMPPYLTNADECTIEL